ncbi:MAG: cysteine desulfurase [Oscillospiraceae bacterium]|nr:cysteine desulfurase [Oscillospiraceae bacterium]
MKVYFDNAATTMVRDEAVTAMVSAMREDFGNPSSTHHMGRQAATLLKTARQHIAHVLGADPAHIFFTSGGTEASNWGILGLADMTARSERHIITSAIEHDAVLESIKKLESMGWEATYLMPDEAGRITAEAFADALRDDTAFCSIMLVNNETGAINPIHEYAAHIKHKGLKTLLHTDAVQAFCKIPICVKTLGADIISISAHKIHGPKGAGALYAKPHIKLPQALLGGSQERGKRPGTEALPAIVGFGVAAALAHAELKHTTDSVHQLRTHAISRLNINIPEAVVIGEGDSPFILSLALPGHKSEVLMNFLDAQGICVSKSAACKKGAKSRVLEAMNLKSDIVDGAIRVSFSKFNTIAEIDYFIDQLKHASKSLFKSR